VDSGHLDVDRVSYRCEHSRDIVRGYVNENNVIISLQHVSASRGIRRISGLFICVKNVCERSNREIKGKRNCLNKISLIESDRRAITLLHFFVQFVKSRVLR